MRIAYLSLFLLPLAVCAAALAAPSKERVEEQVFLKRSEIGIATMSHSPPWEVTGPIRWVYLQPLLLDYDNTVGCSHGACLDPVKYKTTVLHKAHGKEVNLSNLDLPIYIGTHLFLSIDGSGEVLHRVAIREGDNYIGLLKELLGVPFVYGPTYEEGLGHQTDRGIGADCVATLIYGQRRLGRHVPYVAPPKLYDYTYKASDHTRVHKDEIQEGDILHFGFQTAVISKDVPPTGRLSDNDKIIHSFHTAVEEVVFSTLGYKDMPYDVLRWN